MKRIILLLVALSFILTSNSSAQNYNSSWDVSIGGGTQMLFSSDVSNLAFKQRLTPSFSLSVGKWITPIWGLRLQAGAYSLNGYSTANGIYLADPLNNGLIYGPNDPVRNNAIIHPDGSYRHYLRYGNIHSDLQLSVFNFLFKNKPHKGDIIPSIGIGYFRTFAYKGTPNVNSISSNFSLMGNYRIFKNLDVNLELSTSVLPDFFDGRISGKTYENNLSATLGVTYRFKAGTYKSVNDMKALNEEIACVEIRHDTIIKYLHDTVKIETHAHAQEPDKVVKKTEFRLTSILFGRAQAKPLPDQNIQIENIAIYLKNNPETKIMLEGYGDKESGNTEENDRIAEARIQNVIAILVNKYKINPSQIRINVIGSKEQPYEKQLWNRVVIARALMVIQ